MSRMNMKLNMMDNTVNIGALGGMIVNLREDKQGHLRLPILKRDIEELYLEGWKGKNELEMKRVMYKLHLQFGHGSGDKIWKLTVDAKWSDGLKEEDKLEVKKLLMEVTNSCEVCRKYKRNPAKPVVGFS